MVSIGVYFIAKRQAINGSWSESNETNDSSVKDFEWHENEEIKIFQKYLRFPTISLESDLGIEFYFFFSVVIHVF